MLSEIEQFQKWLRRRAPHSSTHIHYASDLELFFNNSSKTVSNVTRQDVDEFIELSQKRGHATATINRRIAALCSFYRFLAMMSDDAPANPVRPRRHFIHVGKRLPRDVKDQDLVRLFAVIDSRRDRAIFLLMLRCGLRVGEVRNLSMNDLYLYSVSGSLPRLWLHGKGDKECVAYLSSQAITALQAWLALRETLKPPLQQVFFYRRQPLTQRYAQIRLKTYGKRAGVDITPHQLRHSCATLLLNAGAPALSVQSLLGHDRLDTTLGYARLYDGTIAADYYRAMSQVERLFHLPESRPVPFYTPAELVALVDSLGSGTLNEHQRETVQALREGILSLASKEEEVKV